MWLKVKFYRTRQKSRRRILDGRELAFLGDSKNAVSRVLDIELQTHVSLFLPKQIDTKVKVRNKMLRQANTRFIAILIVDRCWRPAAVFHLGCGEKTASVFAIGECADRRVDLVKRGGSGFARSRFFDSKAAGNRAGLKRPLRRVAEIT